MVASRVGRPRECEACASATRSRERGVRRCRVTARCRRDGPDVAFSEAHRANQLGTSVGVHLEVEVGLICSFKVRSLPGVSAPDGDLAMADDGFTARGVLRRSLKLRHQLMYGEAMNEIASRLVDGGLAEEAQLRGCTPAEIQQFEAELGANYPKPTGPFWPAWESRPAHSCREAISWLTSC